MRNFAFAFMAVMLALSTPALALGAQGDPRSPSPPPPFANPPPPFCTSPSVTHPTPGQAANQFGLCIAANATSGDHPHRLAHKI
jgi:hypothetical protein